MAREADPPVPDDVPAARPEDATPGIVEGPARGDAPTAPTLVEGAAPDAGAKPPVPSSAEGAAPERDAEIRGETVEASPSESVAVPPPPPPPPRRESPLLSGLGYAWRYKRALLAVVVAQLLFGLSIALPFRARVGPYLDTHAHAAAFAGSPDDLDKNTGWDPGLDWGVWADVKRREAPFFEGLGLAMVWVGVLAWLFGQAVAGGILGTAAEDLVGPRAPAGTTPRGRVARFLSAAGTWFFPSLRVSLVFLAVTMLVGRRVIFEVWGGIAGEAEAKAASQAASWWGMRTREGAFLLLFVVLRAVADLGRAHLVVRGRRSAVLSFLRGIGTLARHPLRAGGLAVLVAVPEMLLLFAIAHLMPGFPGASVGELTSVFLVLQAAVLVRWTARAVLLAGNVRLLARPQEAPPS